MIGVAVGLALYGLLARLLYEYFLLHRARLDVQVLYALSLWFLVIALRDSPVDTIVNLTFVVFPAWLVFRVAGKFSRSASVDCEPITFSRAV